MSDKKKIFRSAAEMPPSALSDGDMRWNKTGNWRNIKPYFDPKTSPCIAGCPAQINIQGYIALMLNGRVEEAVRLLWEKNPFPAICGRVCFHPCMNHCTRADFDTPVFIPAIERYLGDEAIKNKLKEAAVPEALKHFGVAVVGGGPAGLSCAYYLAKRGYRVTIFEAKEKLGGVLRYGIPDYRLPKDVLDAELERVLALGIDVRTGQKVGRDISIETLDRYSACFIAIGLQESRGLSLLGEDAAGVMDGIDFLARVNLGERVSLGKHTIVIGGGNTAMDVARCAIRMGSAVSVLYRRTRKEMPAIEDEVEEALAEGVQIHFLTAPGEIVVRDGRFVALRCQEMTLGERDESGRPRPVPVPGAEYVLPGDALMIAVGERPETDIFKNVVMLSDGLVAADEYGRTSAERYLAGGDIVTGAASVVEAIAAGRKAAELIHARLSGGEFTPEKKRRTASAADMNTEYFVHKPQAVMPRTIARSTARPFREVKRGFSDEQVRHEIDRCMSCGVCNACDNCWIFCPDGAVHRENGVYTIDYDYCKGCLICVEECPRGVFSSEAEGSR